MRNFFVVIIMLSIISPCSFTWAVESVSTTHNIQSIPGQSHVYDKIDRIDNWRELIADYVLSRDTTELLWDDGTPEAYYVVSNPPGGQDRFAVCFQPPGPFPMKVIGGRFYTNNTLAFDTYSICPDAGGYPDIFHPIDEIQNISGGSPGWATCNFSGAVFNATDIWAVAHWNAGYMVGIGADSTMPDGYSYWSNHSSGLIWNQWTATDWMMRLSIATVTDSHDVTTAAILEPPGRFIPGDTMHPTAVFGNCGLSSNTFDVTFDILDSANTVIYTSTDNITLASAEVDTVTFTPEWVGITEGMYTYKAYTSLAGDIDPSNDTIRTQGLCTREIIITYCGDYTNMGEAIIGTWATNRKFMVRMTPPVSPPYYIKKAQIFLCEENAPIEYLCVCPDNGSGLPDTTITYAIAYNISVPVHHSWATADYGEIEVTQPGDLWVIEKWLEGITEPHIGMEIHDPTTERSWRYYFRNGAGHYENLGASPYFREWYFRLIIAVPPLGIEEYVIGTPSTPWFDIYPNPFAKLTKVSFGIGQGAKSIELRIYDATGRLVKDLSDALPHTTCAMQIEWTGRDDQDKPLPAGIYFMKLKTADQEITKKAVLLK